MEEKKEGEKERGGSTKLKEEKGRGERKRGEERHHPLGNKPRKKELHHQELPWIRSLKRML